MADEKKKTRAPAGERPEHAKDEKSKGQREDQQSGGQGEHRTQRELPDSFSGNTDRDRTQ
jgi:hypothetical protein